ncbi:MAG: FHA domain-containing protein [Firmicutes bacterium]|nr:FHA domain-containing protein [Bacillota bacterium]
MPRNLSKKGIDFEGNEALTLKRAKLNSGIKSLSTTESGFELPCQTKQFRNRRVAKRCHRWVFTVLEGNDRGRQFIGATPELKVGRQPENHICLRDSKVSRFHALIKVKDYCLIIKDLQSTNGTFINNVKVKRDKLHTGDLIKIGDTILQATLETD